LWTDRNKTLSRRRVKCHCYKFWGFVTVRCRSFHVAIGIHVYVHIADMAGNVPGRTTINAGQDNYNSENVFYLRCFVDNVLLALKIYVILRPLQYAGSVLN